MIPEHRTYLDITVILLLGLLIGICCAWGYGLLAFIIAGIGFWYTMRSGERIVNGP